MRESKFHDSSSENAHGDQILKDIDRVWSDFAILALSPLPNLFLCPVDNLVYFICLERQWTCIRVEVTNNVDIAKYLRSLAIELDDFNLLEADPIDTKLFSYFTLCALIIIFLMTNHSASRQIEVPRAIIFLHGAFLDKKFVTMRSCSDDKDVAGSVPK